MRVQPSQLDELLHPIIDPAVEITTKARISGISTEIYLNDGKIAKKITYADKLGIPYIVVVGENEMKSGVLKLKNMSTGVQEEMTV